MPPTIMGSLCCSDQNMPVPSDVTEDDAVHLMDDGMEDKYASTLINMRAFKIERVLGKGAFGKVLLVTKTDTEELYAMKVINKAKLKSYKQKVHAIAERKILERVHSPFIVTLHFAFQTASKLYLVMDFMRGGELFYHLRHLGKFSEDRARFYAAEVVLAFEALHSKRIIYRDLKPENVLLDEEGHLKLADFNLSKLTDGQLMRTFTFCGTPEYISPEVLRGEAQTKAVDFWSLGALLYEMLTGSPPFYSPNRDAMFKNILSQPLQLKPYFSPEASDLLRKLLQTNPLHRLSSVAEAKDHAFFSSIDWVKLARKDIAPPFRPKMHAHEKKDTASPETPPALMTSMEKEALVFDQFTYNESVLR